MKVPCRWRWATLAVGSLGELFLKFDKQGSTLAGVTDLFSIVTSVALHDGVPLKAFVKIGASAKNSDAEESVASPAAAGSAVVGGGLVRG